MGVLIGEKKGGGLRRLRGRSSPLSHRKRRILAGCPAVSTRRRRGVAAEIGHRIRIRAQRAASPVVWWGLDPNALAPAGGRARANKQRPPAIARAAHAANARTPKQGRVLAHLRRVRHRIAERSGGEVHANPHSASARAARNPSLSLSLSLLPH